MDYYYCTQDTSFTSEAKNNCMPPECVNISIMDDPMVEMDESFHVSLEIFDIPDQQDRDKFELCSGNKCNCSRLVDIVMITMTV